MEEEFNRVINALPGSVWTALPDGSIDFLNRRWREYTGAQLEKSCAAEWTAAVHPDDLRALLEQWQSILATTRAGEMEARLRRYDGAYRRFRLAANPMRDATGQIIRWYGLNTQIEERNERSRALSDLREDHLRSILDGLPAFISLMTPEGTLEFANRKVLDYFGATLEEVMRWPAATTFHPDDQSAALAAWKEALEQGRPFEFEGRHRRHDGIYRWFHISGFPLHDAGGRIVLWYLLQTDIDERKQAEEAIHSGVLDLRSVINTIPMTAWSTFPDGFCDFCNQRWLDYAGVELEQVQGWGWGTVIHPDDLDGLVEHWQSCLVSGSPVNKEARMRRFDGVYRWFLFLGNPSRDRSGKIVKWFGTNVDIEDRKRAEEEVRANERDLIRIINTIPTTAWATRPDGYCEFLSDRWLDYAGFTYEEAVGWNWATAIHPDDAAALQEHWQRCLATGTPVNTEARIRRFDGVYRWFLFLAHPLRDESGVIIKWYGTNVDIEDRKQADSALRESERNLVRIINTIPTTAWATRPDGYCEFLSDRWLDYAGFTYEEAVGWRWASAIHPDDAAGLQEYWQRCLTTGMAVNTEARIRRFDGVYRWFLFLAQPFRDESGTIVKWYGTSVDIEDRKQAEEALRASARNLNLIINTIPMLAWSTGPDGLVEFLNQRWLDFAGLSSEEAAGWGWAAAVHPEDAKGLLDYWQAALATGNEVDVEARMRRFDGVYRWFLFRASPLRDEAGKIIKWYGTNVDIEDRKRADEELRRSEAFLAEGQRLNRSGSFSWRLDTDKITLSEQLYRIYELEHDKPVTLEQIVSRVHPEDFPLVSDKIARARSGHGDLNYEFRVRMPDGSVKYLRTVAHVTRDRDGRAEIIGAVQDVTERQLAEEALGKIRSELARMARVASLGALTASIAHEVSQPLSGIITNASTGMRMLGADPPNVDGALETARRTLRDGNRASEVISKLRALFSNKNAIAEAVNLNAATKEVLALLLSELQRNRVVLRSELADDLPPVVGDRIQLQQVIMNLVLNASDAMSEIDEHPRRLEVKTEHDGDDNVRMSVTDSGVGISPESVQHIFEAFYTTKNGGMGMGLSVSRSIIESHHGRLWASPNDGPGTTFSFSIPRASGDVAEACNLGSIQQSALNKTQSVMRNL